MVQSDMGLAPEYIDVVPEVRKVKKMIWNNDEWEEKMFFRMLPPDGIKGRVSRMEQWCRERYGEPELYGPWFKASAYIIMDEKVYVFWKLCE